jgi:outer membrane protein
VKKNLIQRWLVAQAVIVALGLPQVVRADIPPFTIQDAMTRALEKNPSVLSAREAEVQDEANIKFAYTKLFPVVNGTLVAAHNKSETLNSTNPLFQGSPYNEYTAGLTLTQPLYSGALFPGVRYAEKDLKIKRYAEEIQERTTEESVVEAFYSVLENERLLRLYKEAQKVNEDILVVAKRYERIGRAQKLDVLQVQTQVAQLTPTIAQAEDAMRTAAAQLATLIRSLDANAIRLQGAFVVPQVDWVKKMVGQNKKELPDVLQARETVNQYEDTRAITMATYWPTLNFVATTQRDGYSKQDLTNSDATSWGMSLQLNVPIFAGLGSFKQDEVLASQERQLELAETSTADTVSVNQIQTEHDFEAAVKTLESSKLAADYGIETLKEAQRTYRLQMINYLQFQTSEQAFLTAQEAYIQAKYNYIVTLSKYFNAMGVPDSLLIAKLDELTKTAPAE